MLFPNLTLQQGWYKAKEPLFSLSFINCRFTSIETNALLSDVFKDIRSITFRDNIPFEYRNGMLNGLPRLCYLYLENTILNSMETEFLQPTRGSLEQVLILNSSVDFNIIFGVHKHLKLQNINVENNLDIRVLASTNFSGVSMLKRLVIINCGIESIQENAFDCIGISLKSLVLYRNKLKIIPVVLFNNMIEKNLCSFSKVELFENLWTCGCDLLEIENVANAYLHEVNLFSREPNYCQTFHGNSTMMNCPNIQYIHNKAKYFNATREIISYARFSIKLENDEIIIKSSSSRKIRLWITDHDMTFRASIKNVNCPRFDWIDLFTKCISIKNVSARIPITKFESSYFNFKSICLNYLAANETLSFWPINCISYKQNVTKCFCETLCWLMFTSISILSFLFGILLIYVYITRIITENSHIGFESFDLKKELKNSSHAFDTISTQERIYSTIRLQKQVKNDFNSKYFLEMCYEETRRNQRL